MKKVKSKNKIYIKYTVLLIILGLLIPILSFYQYKWIGELNRYEKEHLKQSIELSAVQTSFEYTSELMNIYKHLAYEQHFDSEKEMHDFINRTVRENFSKLSTKVSKIWFKSAGDDFNRVDINGINSASASPDKVIAMTIDTLEKYSLQQFERRMPIKLKNNFMNLYIPFFVMDEYSAFLVLELNDNFSPKALLTELIDRKFPKYKNMQIFVSLKNENGELIYKYPNNVAFENLRTEVSFPFGMLPPPNGFMGHNQKDKMFGGKFMINPKILKNMVKKDKPGKIPNLGEISFKLKKGEFEHVINYLRTRNLSISFSILSILVLIVVYAMYLSFKTMHLAEQKLLFISGISHELRTPLTVIRSSGDNLSKGIVNSEERSKLYGNMIVSETDKLWEMLETILQYAGAGSFNKKQSYTNIDLEQIWHEITASYNDLLTEKSIQLKINIDKSIPNTKADLNSLRIVLKNIFDNAVKFNKIDGSITISAKYDQGKKHIVLKIEDTGMGILKKDLKMAFEPFYRSENALISNINGLGVGLALVDKVCKANNWKIEIDSVENKGTIVTLILLANNEA